MASVIDHAMLPLLSVFVIGFGSGSLSMRRNSIRVLGEDYLRVARLRGLGRFRIATRYVARNAILPIYTALMTMTDIVMTIPGLPLTVIILAIYRPKNPTVFGSILAINNWPGLARSIRSQVLTIRTESYVEAARTMGLSTPAILRRDVIPQIMPYTLINAAAARGVIIEAVGLFFLGLAAGNYLNWGVIMNRAYKQGGAISNPENFHWLFFPMLALALLSFGLIMFSQGLDRVFNPRLRAKHAKTVGGNGEEHISD